MKSRRIGLNTVSSMTATRKISGGCSFRLSSTCLPKDVSSQRQTVSEHILETNYYANDALTGHGLTQTIGQMIVEGLMLGLLIWNRPYERRSGNIINIFIQVVRVLSVVCILVFVEELGIAQTTQTVTGVVLIAVQSVLTGVLAILIAVNAIIMCCKVNPHRKRRKEAEKLNRDLDNLTPLDARNSLLMGSRTGTHYDNDPKNPLVQQSSDDSFMSRPPHPYVGATPLRPYSPQSQPRSYSPQTHRATGSADSVENLVRGAAPLGGRVASPPRQPTVPNIQGYDGYRGRY